MAKAEQDGHGDGQNIVMKFVKRDILSDLTKKGFEVPGIMTLHGPLTSELEPLPDRYFGHAAMLLVAPMDTY